MKTLLFASGDPLDHVLPHALSDEPLTFWNVDFSAPLSLFTIKPHATYFTNQLMMTLVAGSIVLLLFLVVGRRYAAMASGDPSRGVPRGFMNLIEAMLQFIRNSVVHPVLGDKTDRFMPFLWTIFFYVLVCNLLGMIPIAEIIAVISGGKIQHWGGTATGNIMITAGLAACAFLMIHYSGAKEVYQGLKDGTYGHHHELDENHALHGEGHGYGLAHDAEHPGHHTVDKGMTAGAAMIMAPILYVWNFAPHVFAKTEHREKPSIVFRILMAPVYIIVLALTMRVVGSLFGPVAAAGAQYVGVAFGLIAAVCAGGLHWTDIVDAVMWVILLLLEGVGALIKPFALAIRLFANMVAGHVVLASLLALIGGLAGMALKSTVGPMVAIGCAALGCLELFVAFLQAYIFTFLTTLFIGASVSPEH